MAKLPGQNLQDEISEENNRTMDRLPLDGVRIADFSWQIAGPTCTRYLGALGAEVIRIESNRRPDPYRERSISQFINQNKKKHYLEPGRAGRPGASQAAD